MNATAVSSLGKGWYASVGMGNKRMFTLNENPQLPMAPAQARRYNQRSSSERGFSYLGKGHGETHISFDVCGVGFDRAPDV